MDNLSSFGGQPNAAGSEYTNWRFDGSVQRFPYMAIIYTAIVTGNTSNFLQFF